MSGAGRQERRGDGFCLLRFPVPYLPVAEVNKSREPVGQDLGTSGQSACHPVLHSDGVEGAPGQDERVSG